MPSRAVVLVVVSFLLVTLIYSSVAQFDVFARKKITTLNTCYKSTADKPGATSADVCCTMYYTNGILTSSLCQKCNYDSGGNKIDCRNYNTRVGQTGGVNPLPSAGAEQPPTGNSTNTPPPGSITKVPPGTTNAHPTNNGTSNSTLRALTPVNHTNALPTGNNTITPPPALKLSQPSLAEQQPQTQQTTGHHQHKGSSTGASTSTGSNSTGH